MNERMAVKIKRAYDKPAAQDGVRILVDGLWPRGISKGNLKIAEWEKAIAPSKALRMWYGHQADRWPAFRERYRKELEEPPRKETLHRLIRLAGEGNLTLVFGARDAEHSNAAVIAEVIKAKLEAGQRLSRSGGRKSRNAHAARHRGPSQTGE